MKVSASIYAVDLLPYPPKKTLLGMFFKRINIFQDSTPEEIFKQLKNFGVNAVEMVVPSNFSESDQNYIHRILKKNKMAVNSVHQPLHLLAPTTLPEVEVLFPIARKFESKVIVLHLSSARDQIYDKAYLSRLHTLQKQYGIKLGFENNQKRVTILNKKEYFKGGLFEKIVKKADFGMTFDTTHLADTGEDIIEFYERNRDRIINIQISDYKYHPLNPGFHLVLGEGTLPIKDFLKKIRQEKYKGLLTMEINTDVKGLCTSAKLIKSLVL